MDKIEINKESDVAVLDNLQILISHYPGNQYQIFPDFSLNAHLDMNKLKEPLYFRRKQEGDKFVPLGMKLHKKLSDFLIDEKVPLPDKENQWVLVSGDEIAWVVGRRISDNFKITDETTEILEFTINLW